MSFSDLLYNVLTMTFSLANTCCKNAKGFICEINGLT